MKIQFTYLTGLCACGILGFSAWAAGQESTQPPSKEDMDSAVGCSRTINTAEVTYAATYNRGYSPTLAALGEPAEGAAPSPSAAALIDRSLRGGKRNGYVFTYQAGKPDVKGQIKTYTVTVRPLKWQKGVLSVFTDETGIIRGTREDRSPTAKDPAL